MKVLVVTNMYPSENMPFYGIFVKEQVDSLLVKGINADVFFVNGRKSRWNYMFDVFPLLKTVRSGSYDIIHLHHTYCAYLLGLVKMFYRKKIPTILTLHEGEIHRQHVFREIKANPLKTLVFSRKLKKIALKLVDFVISVQEDLLNTLEYKGKYAVIPCGVDMNLFQPMEKEVSRRKMHLPLMEKIVFFPASPLNGNKGIDVLKDAMNRLKRRDMQLITAGNISHEEMPFYMSAADVIVQLSEFEASPMVLKEAMSVNVPVVFTDVGDAREIIGNTKGCFVCERNSESVAYYLEKAIACSGRSHGRERILEIGVELSNVAWKIINVYEGLLTSKVYESDQRRMVK